MSNEVTKPEARALDNFADFDVSTEGDDDGRSSGGLLVGTRLRFTNEWKWLTTNEEDCSGRILLASNVKRVEIKWSRESGGPPVDSRELKPGEKFRDMEALNETCPRTEWRTDFNGQPKGPWEIQHVLEFADLATMERFSWPTSTIGGSIAVSELIQNPDETPVL